MLLFDPAGLFMPTLCQQNSVTFNCCSLNYPALIFSITNHVGPKTKSSSLSSVRPPSSSKEKSLLSFKESSSKGMFTPLSWKFWSIPARWTDGPYAECFWFAFMNPKRHIEYVTVFFCDSWVICSKLPLTNNNKFRLKGISIHYYPEYTTSLFEFHTLNLYCSHVI